MFNSRIAAALLGLTFLFVGIIGFIPNPLVSANGLFVTNAAHNFVHLLTGAAFFAALGLRGKESTAIMLIGGAYALVAVLGFLTEGDRLLGLVHINQADRWLHVFLAAAILVIGKIVKDVPATDATSDTVAANSGGGNG